MRFPFEVEGRLSPVFSDDDMAEEFEKGFASLRGMSPCRQRLQCWSQAGASTGMPTETGVPEEYLAVMD